MVFSIFPFSALAKESVKETDAKFGKLISESDGVKNNPEFKYDSASSMIADMQLISKNENFALYFHKTSLAIGVVDLKTGAIHLSNPYDAGTDSNYIGSGEERLDSQIVLYYINSSSKSDYLYSSTDSIELGQYKVRIFENGVKVDYSIGEEFEQPIYPQVMSVSYFKKVTSKLSDRDLETIKGYYIYTDIKQVEDNNRKKWLRDNYPLIDSEPLYITPLDLFQREQHNLSAIFKKVGYTKEQFQEDSEKYGFELEINKYPNFKLTLEFLLTDEGLKVNIPYDSIKSSNETFKLQSMNVLPFLVSDVCGDGTSYIFVPDGAGAIYDINENKYGHSKIVNGTVYGEDISNIHSEGSNSEQYYMPIYGIVKNDGSGIFSIIDSGSEMSTITTRLKAHGTRYSTVNNSFTYSSNAKIVKDTQKKSEGSEKTIFYFDKNPLNTDFSISYYFLSGEMASYNGMAKIYREKLLGEKELKKDFKGTQLVLETVGSALYDKEIFGIDYKKEATFTSYEQNIEILEYFYKNDIKNTSLVLSGWQKNGLDTSLNKKIKFSSALGGKSDFKKLVKKSNEFSTNLFVQQNVAYVSNDADFDSFIKNSHTARCLDYSLSTFLSTSFDNHLYKSGSLTVTPSKYSDFLEPFFKSAKDNSVNGVEVASFGKYLNSNFNENKHKTNRVQARVIMAEVLASNCQNANISVDGANAYNFPYVDQIRNIPSTSGGTSEDFVSVPFMQLLLSGKVSYSSKPLNLEFDYEDLALFCIETATSPSFNLIYDESQMLKVEELSHLYDCVFEHKKEWITSVYKYIENALKVTEGSAFIKHEYISDLVSKSYFENGAVICVNRGISDYQYQGITVPAMNYAVLVNPQNSESATQIGKAEDSQNIRTLWEESKDSNNNFYTKYQNAGYIYLDRGDYSKAMTCFEIIADDVSWESAYKLYRVQILTDYWYIFWPAVLLLLALIVFVIIILAKRIRKKNKEIASGKFLDEILYGFYVLINPFKGFKAIKHENRGSARGATFWLATGSVCAIFSVMDSSYFYENSDFTVLTSLANTLFPLLLWCVANMCFTTLMNGKGTLKEVYTAVGYASIPYTLISLPCTLISTVLVTNEMLYLSYAGTVATSLVLILVFIGMMKTHAYSFFKNLLVTVLTICGMAFILFLIFVFAGLVFRMTATVVNMVYEVIYRL